MFLSSPSFSPEFSGHMRTITHPRAIWGAHKTTTKPKWISADDSSCTLHQPFSSGSISEILFCNLDKHSALARFIFPANEIATDRENGISSDIGESIVQPEHAHFSHTAGVRQPTVCYFIRIRWVAFPSFFISSPLSVSNLDATIKS